MVLPHKVNCGLNSLEFDELQHLRSHSISAREHLPSRQQTTDACMRLSLSVSHLCGTIDFGKLRQEIAKDDGAREHENAGECSLGGVDGTDVTKAHS